LVLVAVTVTVAMHPFWEQFVHMAARLAVVGGEQQILELGRSAVTAKATKVAMVEPTLLEVVEVGRQTMVLTAAVTIPALVAQGYSRVLPGHPLKERVVGAVAVIWMLAAEVLVALVVVVLVVITTQALQQEMGLLEL
jgi:hypothetical protein